MSKENSDQNILIDAYNNHEAMVEFAASVRELAPIDREFQDNYEAQSAASEAQAAREMLELQTYLHSEDVVPVEQAIQALIDHVRQDNPTASVADVTDLLVRHLKHFGQLDRQLAPFSARFAQEPAVYLPSAKKTVPPLRAVELKPRLTRRGKSAEAERGADADISAYDRYAQEFPAHERALAAVGSWLHAYENWRTQKDDLIAVAPAVNRVSEEVYRQFAQAHPRHERMLAAVGGLVHEMQDKGRYSSRRFKQAFVALLAATVSTTNLIMPTEALAKTDIEQNDHDEAQRRGVDESRLEVVVENDRGGRHLPENIEARSSSDPQPGRDDRLEVIVRSDSPSSSEAESDTTPELTEAQPSQPQENVAGSSAPVDVANEQAQPNVEQNSGDSPSTAPLADAEPDEAVETEMAATARPAADSAIIIERNVEQSRGGVSYTFQPGDSVWAVLRDVWGQEPTWDQIAAVLGSNGVDVSEVYGQAGQYDIAIGDTIFIPTYMEALNVPTPIDEVAAKYDTTAEVIRALNPDLESDGDLLAAGQEVRTTPVAVTEEWGVAGEPTMGVVEVSSAEVVATEGDEAIQVVAEPVELTTTTEGNSQSTESVSTDPTDTTTIETQPEVAEIGVQVETESEDPAAELERLLSNPNFEALDGYDRLHDGSPESQRLIQLLNEATKRDVVVMTEAFSDLGDGRLEYEFVNNVQLAEFLHSLAADNPYRVVEVDAASDPSKIRIVVDSTHEPAAQSEITVIDAVQPAEETTTTQPEQPTTEATATEPEVATEQPGVEDSNATPPQQPTVPAEAVETADQLHLTPEFSVRGEVSPETPAAAEHEVEVDNQSTPEILHLPFNPSEPTPLIRHIPVNLGAPNADGNYQIPESPNGRWQFSSGTPGTERWASYAMSELVETVSLHWAQLYPEDVLVIGDANAEEGHVSHVNGVDLDITVTTRDAANTNGDPIKSLQLAQLITRVGTVKQIFYNDEWVISEFNTWAEASGYATRMQWVDNHHHHFHIRLNDEFRGPYSGSGAETAVPAPTPYQYLEQHVDRITEVNCNIIGPEKVREIAGYVANEAKARGIPVTPTGLAAMVAMFCAESSLNHNAVGGLGEVGLWQAYQGRAVGMPTDAAGQVRHYFDDIFKSSSGARVLEELVNPTATTTSMAAVLLADIRPAGWQEGYNRHPNRFEWAAQILHDMQS